MRHPNKILGAHADPYSTYPNQRFALGQVMEVTDGRLYRFAENGAAALAAAKLCSAQSFGANFDTLAVQAAVAVGATTIPFTTGATALVENELAEGTILVEDVALNLGELYPIKSHPSAGTTSTATMTLQDGVTVLNALTTSGKVTVRPNPWSKVIIHGSPPIEMIVGIPQVIVGLTEYGWLQTHGVCNVLVEGAVWVIGQGLRASESVDGGVTLLDFDEAAQADRGLIGFAVIAGTDADFGPMFLKLD